MIQDGVYRVKKLTTLPSGIELKEGQEVEIVNGVVYINGNLLPPEYQSLFIKFIENNKTLFDDVTRQW